MYENVSDVVQDGGSSPPSSTNFPNNMNPNTSSSYTTERRKAWAFAERIAPDDKDRQNAIFEKELDRQIEITKARREKRKRSPISIPATITPAYDDSKFHRKCSGFGHFNGND